MVSGPSSLESVANPLAVLILAGRREDTDRAGFSAKQAGKHLVIAVEREKITFSCGLAGACVCLALPP